MLAADTTIYFRMDGTYTEKVNYTKPKLDAFGNPVVNFKSMKATSKGLFKKMRTPKKRGRPRTRPERTTPKRPYVRSYNFTKAKIAERKLLAKAKRATKMANKRAPKINFPPHDDSKSIKENVAIQEAIKKARGRNRLPVVLGPFS